MKVFVALLFAITFSTVLGEAPENCSLNVRHQANVTTSVGGSGLDYCARPERQCCSNGYFTQRIRELRQGLLSGLREQISMNGDILNNIKSELREYVNNVFIPRLLILLEAPINNLPQNVSNYNNTIRTRFFIRPNHPGEVDFTVQGFTQSFINSQINLLIHNVVRPFVPQINGSGSPLDDEDQICARNIFNNYVNQTTKMRVDRSIQQLRLAITAIDRVQSWFDRVFLPNLTRLFNPLDACYSAFINVRCQDCVQNISRNCRGVCDAITYGCYSVIQNGLSGQFNILWNVTDQLVRISREAVRNVSAVLPDNLLTLNFANISQLSGVLMSLQSECDIDISLTTGAPFPQPRTLNSADVMIDIPDRIVRNATFLLRKGLVYYSGNTSRFCRENSNMNCWNGTRNVTVFVPSFVNTSIDAQANNPYFNVSVAILRREVLNLGNPVTDYLTSNTTFQDVAPQELVIPEDTPYTGSGAGSLMMSTLLMVFLTIFYTAFA